jgi:hypothetical protein
MSTRTAFLMKSAAKSIYELLDQIDALKLQLALAQERAICPDCREQRRRMLMRLTRMEEEMRARAR